MALIKIHKVALDPTDAQGSLFAQHAGYARKAYNWALGCFKAGLDADEWLSDMDLRRRFNAVKFNEDVCPWARPLSQNVSKNAIINVGKAVKAWQNAKQANDFPTFKGRRGQRSFQIDNGPGTIRTDGKLLHLPKFKEPVKMREALRFEGSIRTCVIVQDGGRWFACFAVKTDAKPLPCINGSGEVGVDVGVKTLAVDSNGNEYHNPKALYRFQRKLARTDKAIARSIKVNGKKYASKRRERLYARRRKIHARIANIRNDAHHKSTTAIIRSVVGGALGIESLHVRGMLKMRSLSKALSDSALDGFLSKLVYKAHWNGVEIMAAPQRYPSSKCCSCCGAKKTDLTLSDRTYICANGCDPIDRDLNAALNLRPSRIRTWLRAHQTRETDAEADTPAVEASTGIALDNHRLF